MIGNMSIDLSLKNTWNSWFVFRKGKHSTVELNYFQYYLEKNLYSLFVDLNSGRYHHGGYREFIVCDNKRRKISVASVRDRVVHRLVYDYLNKIYDRTFIYDAWSCRLGKGLSGAIERAQVFLKKCKNGYVWKCDIKKFFDSVDQKILLEILSLRIKDFQTFSLLKEIISSFTAVSDKKAGIPIGNLTSQIFANIYMNELDRFVKHNLKPKAYLRYGDDFIVTSKNRLELEFFRSAILKFFHDELKLSSNHKNDKIIKIGQGLKFLGVILLPSRKRLNERNFRRTKKRLNIANISSYSGLIKKHGNSEQKKQFDWVVCENLFK